MSNDGSDTENGQIPLIFIHGAWLSARSWENYVDYFNKCGFAVSVPEWPRKQGDVEELRETADASAVSRIPSTSPCFRGHSGADTAKPHLPK